MSTLEDILAGRTTLEEEDPYMFNPALGRLGALSLLEIIEDHITEQFEKRGLL